MLRERKKNTFDVVFASSNVICVGTVVQIIEISGKIEKYEYLYYVELISRFDN